MWIVPRDDSTISYRPYEEAGQEHVGSGMGALPCQGSGEHLSYCIDVQGGTDMAEADTQSAIVFQPHIQNLMLVI